MYLVVKFFDNDFGTPMLRALERLWKYIHDNNARLAGQRDGEWIILPSGSLTICRSRPTLTKIYQKLHECGALESLILRLFVLEQLCQDVEHKTRDLARNDVDWNERIVKDPLHLTDDLCLSVDARLYGTYEVIPDIEHGDELKLPIFLQAVPVYEIVYGVFCKYQIVVNDKCNVTVL